jgi:hypothetical protein
MKSKLINSKKGFEVKYLVWAIVFLALIALLGTYVLKIGRTTKPLISKAICEADIRAQEAAHIKGFDFSSKIRCPTEFITIKTDDQNKIKGTIASTMYNCSKRYKRGKKELFGEEQTYCDICAVIKFETKTPISGLSKYFLTEKTPEGISYMDYLMGHETEEAAAVLATRPDISASDVPLDPSKTYSVIFVYAKGKSEIDSLREFLEKDMKRAGGMVAGGVLVTVGVTVALIAGGPITIGAGIVVAAAGAVMSIYNYFAAKEPEWASVTIFREFETESLRRLCDYLPIVQNLEET